MNDHIDPYEGMGAVVWAVAINVLFWGAVIAWTIRANTG